MVSRPRASADLIAAAKIPKARIDGLAVASFTLAPDTAVGLTQHLGLTVRWLDHVPMGGASGIVSIRRAARAVQSGDAEIVACIAGDTNHTDSFRRNTSAFSQFSQDAVYPYGSGGPNTSFAFLTAYYMRTYGAEREDFGKLCVAQRNNALKNPLALFKKPLTLEQYLDARLVADPLRLFDCVMPCAGAEGFLVMRRATASELGSALRATARRHRAAQRFSRRSGAVSRRLGDGSRCALRAGRRRAGGHRLSRNLRRLSGDQRAAVRRAWVSAAKARAPAFIRANTFEADGSFPFNTSGGQLSVGQAGAAGGHLGITEAIRQLTGETPGARVADARHGIGLGLRHDQLRSRSLQRRRRAGGGLSAVDREGTRRCRNLRRGRKRKNPILRTRQPTLPPASRSRVALGLTAAAARGRFALQVCATAARSSIRRARSVGTACRTGWSGGHRMAAASLSPKRYCATRRNYTSASGCPGASALFASMPASMSLPICTQASARRRAGCGSKRRSTAPGRRRSSPCRNRGGRDLSDDPKLREMTCDPRGRKILVTDGKSVARTSRSCARSRRPAPT